MTVLQVLVTGGAGYIGSVVTAELIAQGHQPVVLDNLAQGHEAAVSPGTIFIRSDLADQEAIDLIFHHHQIEAVIHLAADSVVEYSVSQPSRFIRNNVVGGLNLLDVMVDHGVKNFVFSSSAAVYGSPKETPIPESASLAPVNAYGETKAMFERILHWYWIAHNLKYISLRYFNVVGASKELGEAHQPETHLLPNILKVALGQRDNIVVYGTDYDTRDGSCIRDYIHVVDIARALILSLDRLQQSPEPEIYNLGNGEGYSVLEVIEAARRVTGHPIPAEIHPRRIGDPPVLVASADRARQNLGWKVTYPDIDSMIASAWQWHKAHPTGYNDAR